MERRLVGRRPARIGLLGGTFDPPHLGHLQLADLAWSQLELTELRFLPVGRPPHKPDYPITADHHRCAMLERALAGRPHFQLDSTDLRRPPPHFTATLLALLRRREPEAHFWLVMGGDSLRDLLSWHEPEHVLSACRLAVLPRAGAAVDWPALTAALPTLPERLDWLDGEAPAVSASALRRQIRAGQRPRAWLPAGVWDYIQARRLYAPGPANA